MPPTLDYGDLLRKNPHFKDLYPPNPFESIVRAKLTPSAAVAAKMVKGPHPVCIHVRHDLRKTEATYPSWLNALKSSVAALVPAGSPVLLFTMYADVRAAVSSTWCHRIAAALPVIRRLFLLDQSPLASC